MWKQEITSSWDSKIFSSEEKKSLEIFVSNTRLEYDDCIWEKLFSIKQLLNGSYPESFRDCLCQQMALHDLKTGNFQTLILHLMNKLLSTLRRYSSDDIDSNGVHKPNLSIFECDAIGLTNALFLARNFILYLSENQQYQEIELHFNYSGMNKELDTTCGKSISQLFLSSLIATIVDFEPNKVTYDLHLEVLNTFFALLSPQLFSLNSELLSSSILELVFHYEDVEQIPTILQKLLNRFLLQMKHPNNDNTTNEINKNSTLTSSMFQFSWQMYSYLFPVSRSGFPLSERSLLFLLLLLHSFRSPEQFNPFRDTLKRIKNENDQLEITEIKKEKRINFDKIFDLLGRTIREEASSILLYSLLQDNLYFADMMLARSDLDTILLPLLEKLYDLDLCKSQLYVYVILILIFTEDTSFSINAHKRVILSQVPWFKERYLRDISLGSLIFVILLKLIQFNITTLQDSFLHTNCFGALANMSPYALNLHGYACDRLIGLIETLHRKISLLKKKLQTEQNDDSNELRLERIEAYTHFVELLVGITSSCINPTLLQKNSKLIYALLHQRSAFEALSNDLDSLGPILTVIEHFSKALDAEDDSLDAEVVLQHIQDASLNFIGTMTCTQSDFKFQFKEVNSESFFVPFIWSLIVKNTQQDLAWKLTTTNSIQEKLSFVSPD